MDVNVCEEARICETCEKTGHHFHLCAFCAGVVPSCMDCCGLENWKLFKLCPKCNFVKAAVYCCNDCFCAESESKKWCLYCR